MRSSLSGRITSGHFANRLLALHWEARPAEADHHRQSSR